MWARLVSVSTPTTISSQLKTWRTLWLLRQQQQDQADMPHQWVRPEHMTYTGDKSAEFNKGLFSECGPGLPACKGREASGRLGFGRKTEIKKVLDKERESAIAKALKDLPSNPAAPMQAKLAEGLYLTTCNLITLLKLLQVMCR
jgi:hypothetical protein